VLACSLESENKRKGTTSLQIVNNRVIVNNMSNQVLSYNLHCMQDEPAIYTGHRSTFFTKASACDGVIACGSQDRHVYLWSSKCDTPVRLGSDDRMSGHLHEVNDVCVTGTHVLSSSDDASVLIWQI